MDSVYLPLYDGRFFIAMVMSEKWKIRIGFGAGRLLFFFSEEFFSEYGLFTTTRFRICVAFQLLSFCSCR